MKRTLLCGLLMVFATHSLAHQLDEYLQVTRISISTNRIDFSINLTPGVAVADKMLGAIDTDLNGQISGEETGVYAQLVLGDIKVQLDENQMMLKVVDSSFPTIPEMKAGVGVIRLKASAPVAHLSSGTHTLSLTNTHLPTISVYLVNALVPKDSTIRITKQTRDEFQKEYRLEFNVGSAGP